MIHENISERINEIIKLKKCKGLDIYVFGLSYLGKLVVKILKNSSGSNIKILDNNEKLWDTTFDNIMIYNPKVLKRKNKNEILIFITINEEYNLQVIQQLTEYGFGEGEDFYVLPSGVEPRTMISELIYSDKKDTFIFGDSVMNMVAYSDKNMTILCDMITNNLNSQYSFGKFHFRACTVDIFYIALQYLVNMKKIPSLVLMEINMFNFSPYYYKYQNTKVFNEIYLYLKDNNIFIKDTYGFEKEIPKEEYLGYEYLYREKLKIANSYFDYWFKYEAKTLKDASKRYSYLGTWIYNSKIEEDNRNILVLEKILEICINNKIKLVGIIPPINYIQYRRYVGKYFIKYYKINTNKVENIFRRYSNQDICCFDFSCLLQPKEFMHQNDSIHLNEFGRKKLSTEIAKIINKQMS